MTEFKINTISVHNVVKEVMNERSLIRRYDLTSLCEQILRTEGVVKQTISSHSVKRSCTVHEELSKHDVFPSVIKMYLVGAHNKPLKYD